MRIKKKIPSYKKANQKIKLDLNLLKHKKSEKIISTSELPEVHIDDIFQKNKSLKLTGIYSFSRIVFDKTYNYGVLEAGYYCGGKCGHSNCTSSKSVNFSIISYYEIDFKNNSFNFSEEKSKFYHSKTFISSGFTSIWLIPKIG